MFENIEIGVPVDDFHLKPPRKTTQVFRGGRVMVTDDILAESPEWKEETDQRIAGHLKSPEVRAAGEQNTTELFGGYLFGLESFDTD